MHTMLQQVGDVESYTMLLCESPDTEDFVLLKDCTDDDGVRREFMHDTATDLLYVKRTHVGRVCWLVYVPTTDL